MTRFFQLIAAGVMVAAATPAAPIRHDPRPVSQPHRAGHEEVPDIVLIGMAAVGLGIVVAASRRRQPGRSVTH